MKKVSVNIQGKYKSGGTLSKSIIIEVPNEFPLSGDDQKICKELEKLIQNNKEIVNEILDSFYVSSFMEK